MKKSQCTRKNWVLKGITKNMVNQQRIWALMMIYLAFLIISQKESIKTKKIMNINRIIKTIKMKMNLIKIKTNNNMAKMIRIFNNKQNNNMITVYLSKITQWNNNLQSNNN